MDRFTELELFVHTAELGTLSKAAEKLEISNAAASRHLAALEARLKVRLIERNTRRLALTNAGHDFYARCKTLLAEWSEAEASVNASLVEPTGTLTITATVSFSMLHLAPVVPEFQKLYPRIKVKILGANRYYDIMDSEIDLAVRTREFEADSNIAVRKLAITRRVLAASPSYLKRRGVPRTVEALADHDMLIYSLANHPNTMEFTRGDEKAVVKVQPSLEANDGQIVRAAALAGAGILVQPKYIIHDDLISGRLLPVLDDWDLPRLTINLAFQDRRYMPAKTRLFIDFLLEHFKRNEYERYWTR
ncbi:LysR family transcriptional regulator [Pseudomonas daroniae]|uniref:LysR family transcriptional regulator n=1 Tax=Phytopseudomonas daroniae TaxID=2487519 RepID=A0A4Q9QRR2_9GAMM|nr:MULTISPECIES: LysR family transcriptional regulator [Pseudomonas]TBU74653.1 LysR family transcriptional regulator [Pseudomonas daroniae]TBU82040.1 LysR family transcriptional regulator [Pseudomonas daroniae]TBU84624.1 LysR family transcriptional regulator [Pseudomonas sp. FRB 228]TBU92341.1 LysR family transcriptional regulator [Pseudomonas daroniae]